MYEEPHRWVEAVANRRQYLDDQFKQGSPIVALSYAEGILLLTFSRGTPKVYEVYDRIAMGGMGHPADLEKLRFQVLDMAHLEGFNRSPSDVTGARLLKYGLAPTVKQAFEEIFKAPFIVKILLAELVRTMERDQFISVDYDGTFEEASTCAILAGSSSIQLKLLDYLKERIGETPPSLEAAVDMAMKTWAMGSLLHQSNSADPHINEERKDNEDWAEPVKECDEEEIFSHLRQTVAQHTLECCVLDRTLSRSSTYRPLSSAEIAKLLPSTLQQAQ
ncbi:MAG: hypothetical protein ACPGYT_01370 [Nitrospirales bacterium]